MEATDETYTAQYFEDKNHSGKDDEDEKITVTFLPGEHGTLEGADAEGKVQTVDLLKGYDSYPSAPKVNANTDWGFKGWDKGSRNRRDSDEATDETYTAQYS